MAFGLFSEEHHPIVKIQLSQPSYVPGQEVIGQVSLELSKSYRFSEITVKFVGFRKSRTVTRVGKRKRIYYSKLPYFDDTMCIFKDESGEKLAVGEHIFPFSYLLPSDVAETFEVYGTPSTFGRVKYWIKLEVTNPSMFRPKLREKVEIPIFIPHDGTQIPISLSNKAHVFKWFCFGPEGEVSWTAKLDKQVWMAGEVIDLIVFVDNRKSSHKTYGVYANLERKVTLTFSNKKDTITKIICTANTAEMVRAKETGLLTMKMELPNDVQSSCRLDLFNCVYILDVYIGIPYSNDPVIKIPVTICRLKSNETVTRNSPDRTTFDYEVPAYSTPPPKELPPAYGS